MRILCFDIDYVGFTKEKEPWKKLVEEGQHIMAIKTYRFTHSCDLLKAKNEVDAYRNSLKKY